MGGEQTSSSFATLVGLLRRRAEQRPERQAFTYLGEGEKEGGRLTYGELDRQARAIAARLQRTGAAGQRVLLLYPPGLDYIPAFFGCLYAGAVAVLVFPPRLNRPTPRLQAIAADAEAAVALTTGEVLASLERRLDPGSPLAALAWIATDLPAAPAGAPDDWRDPGIDASTVAALQYTSGSTSAPKGVILSHGNFLHNLELIREGFQVGPADRGLSWLPLYHDMGLVGGVLGPIYTDVPISLMSPAAFLQRPLRWLQALAETGGTISGGPNFAYQLCVDRITPEQKEGLDLSGWRLAFCGAEPVRPETLEGFARAFAPCGFRPQAFYPCYGMAETTLIVSGGAGPAAPVLRTVQREGLRQGRAEAAAPGEAGGQTLVGCGSARGDLKICIVDPETLAPCPPGRIGEIWVAGPSVAEGYWRRPQETAESFRAFTSDGDGPFLRTGDLGFLDGGELFVTGRLKDLIVIRGLNHYPQDIELTVARCHPALAPDAGAAFSIDVAGEERLVVAQEVRRHSRSSDLDQAVAAIRRAVSEVHQLQVHAVSLLEPLSLPKTSSGKIQRHACRAGFLDGSLKTLLAWSVEDAAEDVEPAVAVEAEPPRPAAGEAAIRAWWVERLAERLRLDPRRIDVREPFSSFGLDSAQAVGLTGELEQWLGRPLPSTLLYEHPTIESLARYLAHGAEESDAGSSFRGETDEPIAIVGLGCRFPGAHGPAAFWRLLREGTDAIRVVPPDRWDAEALYDADPEAPGKVSTRWGGFLERVDAFDPEAFGISRREAAGMDPQQRILLETAWEAIEDAGIPQERLAGSRTGVFVGISNSEYGRLLMQAPGRIDAYTGSGNALSIAANRLSYVFGLQGPSLAVDTACSSSLVAVHLACRSLREGECEAALAGGVNLLLHPAITMSFTKARAMAADGRCKTFDARADGYVRGEGAGVVVLKRLGRALADGDRVYAVIRGSAVNQDGRTNGLMAPSPAAQEAVLREACARAGIPPGEVRYVEAHGTGTLLGDPIEARALGAVLAAGRPAGDRCAVGSVKTNIGHLEAAAGIAGLIKVALMYEHGEIPRSLHFETPNPHIPFAELPLAVQREPGAWPPAEGPAVAGVSSFGFGGTNAHVVLDRPPLRAEPDAAGTVPPWILALSARSEGALQGLAAAWRDLLREDGTPFPDLCAAAALRRSQHDHRLALVAGSTAEAAEILDGFLNGETSPALAGGRRSGESAAGPVFVFSGQGRQWTGMGRELLETEPAFREAFAACDREIARHAGWSVLEEIAAGGRLESTEVAQPAVFALQVALAALLRSWGIMPAAVVGHSLGEIAAAHVAGALSLEDAARLAVHRGRLMQGASGLGKMASVELPPEEVARRLGPSLNVAAVNSPTTTVVSGDPAALDRLVADLQAEGIEARPLPGDYAFHGPQMAPFQAALGEALAGLAAREAEVPFVSAATGLRCEGPELGAAYWPRQMLEPVRLAAAVDTLIGEGHTEFLEIGPHPVLVRALRQCLRGREGTAVGTLRTAAGEREVLLRSAAALWTRGCAVDWPRLFPGDHPAVRLPSYPWQWERCWLEIQEAEIESRDPGGHPLLGRRIALAHPGAGHLWESRIDARRLPYLDDHRVQGVRVLPGAVYVELALAAGAEVCGPEPLTLKGVELHAPLFLPDGGSRTVQTHLSPDPEGGARFHVHSRSEGGAWTLHASGILRESTAEARPLAFGALEAATEVAGGDLYQALGRRGLEYGPAFRGIDRLWHQEGDVLARIEVPAGVEAETARYRLHPAVLDAAAQVLLALGNGNGLLLPVHVEEVRVHGRPGRSLWSQGKLLTDAEGGIAGDLRLLGETGEVVAEASGLRFRRLDVSGEGAPAEGIDYGIEWSPLDRPASYSPGSWAILADRGGVGEALAAEWRRRGGTCFLVPAGGDPRQVPAGTGIVDLRGLDIPEADLAAARDACFGAAALVQAVAGSASPGRIWLVTRGAQAVVPAEGSSLAISQAPLWGLGLTLAQEHPELWGGLADLDPEASAAENAVRLSEWIAAGGSGSEDQIAFRGGRAWGRRLVRREPPSGPAPRWRPDAAYLITGGLGALGLALARWMVQGGARRLILLGRTEPPPRAQWSRVERERPEWAGRIAAVRGLEALGASIHLAAADVADEDGLRAFLDRWQEEGYPPIRGVAHAAGALDDRTLLRLDAASMAAVWRPKVEGAWQLHRSLADAPLDFFVLFSSAAALIGSAGQASYAAANAFLDALAHLRRARGLPATSFDWGPWADAGMAAGREGRFQLQGIASLPSERALEALGRWAEGEQAQVGVLAVDWSRLFAAVPPLARWPLLSGLAEAPRTGEAAAEKTPASDFRELLLASDPAEREPLLIARLLEEVGRVVGASPARLDPQQPLDALGIDSLMALELKSRVDEELGIAIPIVRLMEGPSIARFARVVLGLLEPDAPLPAEPEPPAPDPEAALRAIVVGIQPAGARPLLFCVHPGALDPACYRPLAGLLGEEQPFYVLTPPELDTYRGLDGGAEPDLPLPELAGRCIAAMRTVQARGPYRLAGWSLGGVVAFEMARQLRAQGEEVDLLALFDSPAPAPGASRAGYEDAKLAHAFARYLGARLGRELPVTAAELDGLDLDGRLRQILQKAKAVGAVPRASGVDQIRSLFSLYRNGLSHAVGRLWRWDLGVYPGRVDFFRARDSFQGLDEIFPDSVATWRRLTDHPLAVHEVPGDHYTMFLRPSAEGLARALRSRLDAGGAGP